MSETTLTGRCMCGAVQFAVEGPLHFMAHCHCSRCRRRHGASTGLHTVAPHEAFRITQGRDRLRTYHEDGFGDRTFCSVCGSSLFYGPMEPGREPWIGISVGALDGDPGVRPQMHMHVASKAPWHPISDGLPQLADGPDV